MPREKLKIAGGKLWDGTLLKLDTPLGVTESSTGIILYGAANAHWTLYVKDGILGAHLTEHNKHGPDLFRLSLPDIEGRLDESALNSLRGQLLGACYRVSDPGQLCARGIRRLLPVPIERKWADAALPAERDGTQYLDASSLQPQDIEAPWNAPIGSVWVGVVEPDELSDLLFVAENCGQHVVLLIEREAYRAWFGSVMQLVVGPNGRIPPDW